jgi:hypothetical protein
MTVFFDFYSNPDALAHLQEETATVITE